MSQPDGVKLPGRSIFAPGGGVAILAAATPLGVTTHDVAVAGLAALGSVAIDRFGALLENISSKRREAAASVVDIAAMYAKQPWDALLSDAVQNPYARRVVAEAVAGAADATFDEKIIALGATLGRALTEPDIMAQRRLLGRLVVLRALEEVHVIALATVADRDPEVWARIPVDERPFWNYADLEKTLHLRGLATPTVETLLANGLILEMGSTDECQGGWATTAFGEEVLKTLRDSRLDPSHDDGGPG